jgi:hypothetical protein
MQSFRLVRLSGLCTRCSQSLLPFALYILCAVCAGVRGCLFPGTVWTKFRFSIAVYLPSVVCFFIFARVS